MKKKRIVKICAAVLILIVFFVQYNRFKQNTQYISSGIDGDEISFGMTLEEVYNLIGKPDGEYQEEEFGHRHSVLMYKDRTFYGLNFSGMHSFSRYGFHGTLDDPSARIDEIYLGFTFANEEECARAMQIICQSLSEEYSKDDRFSERTTEGPATTGPAQFTDRENLILTYRAGSKYRRVRVCQYPLEIQIFLYRSNLPQHFFSWLFSVDYWF